MEEKQAGQAEDYVINYRHGKIHRLNTRGSAKSEVGYDSKGTFFKVYCSRYPVGG